MFRFLKFLRNRKVGLVLGSGGSKGIAHIAVIEYLESLGIPIHMVAGASVGAAIGAVYAAGGLRRLKEDMLAMKRRDLLRYFDPVFPISGLLEGRKVLEFMQRYVRAAAKIEDLPISLAIVATDMVTGEGVVFKSGSIIEAVRASISIPGVFEPVKYRDTVLIDGGVANPLPVDVARDMGAGFTIAVNLHPNVSGEKIKKKITKQKPEEIDSSQLQLVRENGHGLSFMQAIGKGGDWLKSVDHWLGAGKREKKGESLPNIFEVISQSIDIMGYMNTILMLKYNPPTVLIEPDLLDFATLDFTQSKRALDEGTAACKRVHRSLVNRVRKRI